jgi:hypothetical protein
MGLNGDCGNIAFWHKTDIALECAPRGGQFQAAVLTGCRVWRSSNCAGLSYGVNLPDLSRQTALYVDKVLNGAKPAELPVQQPTKFELVINLKTAKALGLAVPPNLLALADDVIE